MNVGFFWVGLAFASAGALYAFIKTPVLWSVATDPQGGGGAPTLDFVMLPPLGARRRDRRTS